MQKQDIETILAFSVSSSPPERPAGLLASRTAEEIRASMLRHEEDLYGALKKDLGKAGWKVICVRSD